MNASTLLAVAQSQNLGESILAGTIAAVVAASVLSVFRVMIRWPRKVEGRLDKQDEILADHTETLAKLNRALTPNGGSSALDKINVIYQAVTGQNPPQPKGD